MKKIYPEDAFEIKTIFGIQIFVLKEGELYDYAHELVEDLKILLNSLTKIRINLIQNELVKEYVDIFFDKSALKSDNLPS